MVQSNERGSINVLLVPLVLVALAFVAVAGVAAWAYQGRQDYKNNSDQKVQAAVTVARQDQQTKDSAAAAEADKLPYRTYNGPSSYGSVVLKYPKTWSGYVNETPGTNDVDGYFDAGVVPDINALSSAFALRIQVANVSYSNVLQQFSSQVQSGTVKVSPYSLPKVPSVVGSRLDGLIENQKSGSLILLPLRDKTLKVWTNSNDFLGDFNDAILPNLSFSP